MAPSAPTLKRLSMELGGDAPFIVFDDADLDAAVEGCIQSKFRNAGQTCVCANRVFVQAGVYDAFKARLVARVAALAVGDGFTPGVAVGPVISAAALARVEALVGDAVAQGAVVLTGGRRVAVGGGGEGGFFYAPTVLEGVPPACALAREEIFGPVVSSGGGGGDGWAGGMNGTGRGQRAGTGCVRAGVGNRARAVGRDRPWA